MSLSSFYFQSHLLSLKPFPHSYDYRREGTRIGFSKTFSLDATRLLPYLYEKFGKQVRLNPPPLLCLSLVCSHRPPPLSYPTEPH